MKILFITPCYNELFLLPYLKKHLDNNKIDLFIIDNMSDDGTEKWIVENNIEHIKLDTGGAFDLRPIHEEMNKVIHQKKPDWLIYGACDMFYESVNGFRGMIELADSQRFDLLETETIDFPVTGEEIKPGNPFKNYYTCKIEVRYQKLIAKYYPHIKIDVDEIVNNEGLVKSNAGVCFEMHSAKTTEQRIASYERRKKAWKNGLESCYGNHYRDGYEKKYIEDPDKCINITETRHIEQFFKMHNL